ncbi:MAG: hypothetical protein ACI9EB_002043 [Pseudomonas sp.]|jgi:hypothetical protein
MQQKQIRLFANNIQFADDEFNRHLPLVLQPGTHQGKNCHAMRHAPIRVVHIWRADRARLVGRHHVNGDANFAICCA